MEILSDATFRGTTTFNNDVTIDGGDFSLTVPGKSVPLVTTKRNITEFSISGVARIRGHLQLDNNAITRVISCSSGETSYSVDLPSTGGTLALTSQIPTVPSVAGFLKYKKIPIDFDVPADCTAFNISENSGNYISDYQVISIGLFKTESHYNDFAFAIKQVQADIFVTCNSRIIVEKSSAFAIGASDGYEIRAAYYE